MNLPFNNAQADLRPSFWVVATAALILLLAGCATRSSPWYGEGRPPSATRVVVHLSETNFASGFRTPLTASEARNYLAAEVARGSVIGGLESTGYYPGGIAGLGVLALTPFSAGVAALFGWAKGMPEKDIASGIESISHAVARSKAVEAFRTELSREGRQRTGADWSASLTAGQEDALLVIIESLDIRFDPGKEFHLSVNPALRCMASATVMVQRFGVGPVLFSEVVSVRRQPHSFRDLGRGDGRLAESEIRAVLCDLSAEVIRRMYTF